MVTSLTNEVFDGNKEFTINPVVKKKQQQKQNKTRIGLEIEKQIYKHSKAKCNHNEKKNPHCLKANQF